jgi:ureidoacrylate peracid hydrolase
MATADVFSAHQAADSDNPAPLRGDQTAILVIDMLNDFCTDGGAMVLPGAQALYRPIQKSVDLVRGSGGQVVWVCDRHEADDDAEFRKRTRHCMAGTWGAQLVQAFSPAESDIVMPKHRYSAFFGTALHEVLQAAGVRRVYLTGVVTNICLRSTAHDAFFLGYDVTVIRDACAATGPREQESSLYDIATHFGTLCTSDQLSAELVAS